MKEASKISYQMNFDDLTNAISSRELEDGHTLSDSQDTQKDAKYGPVHALASLSARQAKEKGLLTSGTFGQHGSISSISFALTRSLVSRLRVQTEKNGSTLFRLIWKQLATPSGWRYYLLRALVRRTAGTEFISWPTPKARDDRGVNTPEHLAKKKAKGHGCSELVDTVKLSVWPTPMAGSVATEEYNCAGNTDYSRKVVELASWVTRSARDWKDTEGMETESVNPDGSKRARLDQLPRQVFLMDSGNRESGSDVQTGKQGQLNPGHSRWLMGYPQGWCESAVMAMQLSRKLRRHLSNPTSKRKKKANECVTPQIDSDLSSSDRHD